MEAIDKSVAEVAKFDGGQYFQDLPALLTHFTTLQMITSSLRLRMPTLHATTLLRKTSGGSWTVTLRFTPPSFALEKVQRWHGTHINHAHHVRCSYVLVIFGRIPKNLPGRGYRVSNTADIPAVLRSILSAMVDR